MQDRSLSPEDLRTIDRRHFVGMLGAGSATLFLGSGLGKFTAWLSGKSPTAAAFDLPEEWVEVLGQPLRGYAAFLGGLQLKHVSVRQLIEAHMKERGGVHAGLPPAGMWMKMKPTLLVADKIGERLGYDVETVISAYRCPEYNKRCPGAASGSQHMRNVALDLQFPCSPSKVAKTARALREEGVFKGGVGLYSNFTHVDTRGVNATWG